WRLWAHWPRIRRTAWTWWIGGGLAFLLIASSWASRLETVYRIMGLVFAPAVGAMVGDFVRQRGGWSGVRDGFHAAGISAWAAGCGIPLMSEIAVQGVFRLPGWLSPSALTGFLTAAVSYWLLARLGLERPAMALSGWDSPEGQAAGRPL